MNVPAAVSAPTMQTGTLILGFTATGMIIIFLVLVALTAILAVSRSLRKPATYGRSASARKRMEAWQTYTDPRRVVLEAGRLRNEASMHNVAEALWVIGAGKVAFWKLTSTRREDRSPFAFVAGSFANRAVLIGVSHYATKINEATVKERFDAAEAKLNFHNSERFVLALGRHPDSSSILIAGGPAGSLLCGRNQRGK